MALADVTLADGKSTPTNHVFSFIGTTNGSRVVRKNLSAASEEPETLSIDHKTVTKGGVKIDSTLARIDVGVLDSDGLVTYPNSIRIVSEISQKVLSDELIKDLFALARNLITEANALALAKGSVL